MNTTRTKNPLESLTHPKTALSDIALPKLAPLSHWLSGDAAFRALKVEIALLSSKAPKDHDVLIQAFGIRVTHVTYAEPHILVLRGFDQGGHHTSVVAHFSQLVAH